MIEGFLFGFFMGMIAMIIIDIYNHYRKAFKQDK